VTVLARRSSLLLSFAVACFAIAMAVSAQQASSAHYTSCSYSKSAGKYGLGMYLKGLKVSGGPTCADGRTFVKDYYKCRTKGSKPLNGKCTNPPHGYSCTEKRTNKTSLTFDGRATCKKGSKRVIHKFIQQFAQ
jgi:plastocyanin domain-containing protein